MNIGIVTTWFERGAAYVSLAYMNSLIENGHNVYIYVRSGELVEKNNVKWNLSNVTYGIRYLPLKNFIFNYHKQYINIIHFDKWLKSNRIDTVIFNEEHGFNTIKRTKALGYTVGAYIDYYKKSTVDSFRIYDFLLCNTKRHYSVFNSFNNAMYIPWGTDVKLYKPTTKEYSDTVVFFHSAGWGGVNTRKGTDLLVEAFQLVKGNVKLIIHSQSPLSRYSDVKKIIQNDSRIEFLNKTVSAPGLYYRGDVFVYPTRLEGIGLSVPEALSCGLPVITTNVAPLNEFVSDDYNGILIDVAKTRVREDNYYWEESIVDINSLANAMNRYANEKELLSLHKLNARKSAIEKLNWSKNSINLGVELNEIVDKNNRKIRKLTFFELSFYYLESSIVLFLTVIRKKLQYLKRSYEKIIS